MNRGEFAGQDLGWLAMASSSSLAFFRIVSQQFDVNYQLSPNPDNSRRSEFKKGIDALEGRRRRSETSISIRKNKKDEGIAKRRLAREPPEFALLRATVVERVRRPFLRRLLHPLPVRVVALLRGAQILLRCNLYVMCLAAAYIPPVMF